MTVRIKDKLEEMIAEIIGPDVVPVIRALRGRENVSEFTLATKIKQEINTTRNILYRLYERSLVRFIRKKDKKKGWYIYYWTFNEDRINALLKQVMKDKLERLNERLSREQNNQFFICESKCVRLDFDQAAGFRFRCPECNKLLEQEDNSRTIENIQENIKNLEIEIAKPIRRPKKKVAKKAKKAKKKTAKPKKKAKKKANKKSKVKKKTKKKKKKR